MKNVRFRLLLAVLLGVTLILADGAAPQAFLPAVSARVWASEQISGLPQLAGMRVGIQAGHGRGDPGALSCDETVQEADITASVARRAVALLQSYGAQADLFVGSDPALSGYTADAFVALHTDWCPDASNPSSPSGFKVARYGGRAGTGLDGSNDASDQLVQALWDDYGLVTALPQDRSPGRFTDDMLYNYALGEIRASTPGAIIEMGFLSGDLNVLVNQQDRLAEGIAASVVSFLASGPAVEPTQPVTPVRRGAQSATVLVVDASGSMREDWRGGVKIESAKQAATDVVNMIEQESSIGETGHQVAVASFSDDATLNLGLTDDYDAARGTIVRLAPLNRTNIGAGLQAANRALASAPPNAQRIIILLSDGLTNEGLPPDQILAGPVQEAAAAGTCIYTVGFGEPGELDEQLLRNIAAGAACGEYHYASAPAELEQVYIRLRHQSLGTIVGEFKGQVAQGETVDAGEVDVPRNQGQMHVTLHWPGSDLDLILTDPRGRRMNETDPAVSLVKYGNMIYLIIENPRPGRWLLGVFGADVPEGILDYDAVVSVRERTGPPPTNAGAFMIGLGLTALVALGLVVAITQGQAQPRSAVGVRVVTGQASRPFAPLRRGRLAIGRHPRCDLVLPDRQVSASHAMVQRTRYGYVLTDLNSKNGTYINGQRAPQALLSGGERLRMGKTELVFVSGRAGPPTRPSPYAQTGHSAHLTVLAGDQEYARYPVAPGTVLGRYEGCPVDLRSDALASRRHARLDYQNGQWSITDLSSDNQTFVNGYPVHLQALQHGDEIRLGNTRMRFYTT
jgi:pSer/pThr/pTyr-binding forkhead associated (FHA) protein/Mg-chelatase subunit ChlD/N-acetylmuramoyl-L-alanine amidase